MSDITDFLPQYRELNTLLANAVNSGEVSYSEQCTITEFWANHSDIKAFEKMTLDIVLKKDKPTCELLLSGIKTEIEKNIRLYESAQGRLNAIDTMQVCINHGNYYQHTIKSQLELTNEYSRELRKIDGSLDAIGFRKHTPQEEELLWQKHEPLTIQYKDKKKDLNELYRLQRELQNEASSYAKNIFEKIYELSIAFLKVIDCYVTRGNAIEKKIDPKQDKTEFLPKPTPEIDKDIIFKSKMYDKFLILEQKLISNNYLNTELQWVSTHDNGKADIKKLVTFLTALIENNYFLPNREPKIKTFFEARYQISIGQNFEKKRRKPLEGEYKVIFFDYPF